MADRRRKPSLLIGSSSALQRSSAAAARHPAGPVTRLMDTLDCLADAEHQLRHAQHTLRAAQQRAQSELLNCEKVGPSGYICLCLCPGHPALPARSVCISALSGGLPPPCLPLPYLPHPLCPFCEKVAAAFTVQCTDAAAAAGPPRQAAAAGSSPRKRQRKTSSSSSSSSGASAQERHPTAAPRTGGGAPTEAQTLRLAVDSVRSVLVRDPTTRTISQQIGPNHFGFIDHSSIMHACQDVPITSDCAPHQASPSAALPEEFYVGSGLDRATGAGGASHRREFCHSADPPSPSALKRRPEREAGAAE